MVRQPSDLLWLAHGRPASRHLVPRLRHHIQVPHPQCDRRQARRCDSRQSPASASSPGRCRQTFRATRLSVTVTVRRMVTRWSARLPRSARWERAIRLRQYHDWSPIVNVSRQHPSSRANHRLAVLSSHPAVWGHPGQSQPPHRSRIRQIWQTSSAPRHAPRSWPRFGNETRPPKCPFVVCFMEWAIGTVCTDATCRDRPI